jgi:membrane associated rhomboid family serine protease
MECPICGLLNPDTALRCDCGYDFQKRSLEKSYSQVVFPKSIKVFFIVFFIWSIIFFAGNVLICILALSETKNTIKISDALFRAVYAFFWGLVLTWLYAMVKKRKNWARIGLAIWTFPIGLIILYWRDLKLYCFQKT